MNSKKKHKREFTFSPRIINPVKINNVIIFSADEQVRETRKVLSENMPWINVDVISDPVSVSNYKSDRASVIIFDDMAMILANTEKLHQNNKDVILVLLSSNEFIHCSPPSVNRERYPYTSKADLIFAINKTEFLPNQIITAVVRCAEDLLNIEKYSKERRFIFLVVDDEPRWFSQFLPVLYNIIGQRADVMVTRTYEETMKFLFGVEKESEIDKERYCVFGHGDDVVCLIADIFFPKGSDLKCDAGRDIINLINKYYPRIPIIIASKAKEVDDFKKMAFILPKGDPGSLLTLSKYIYDYTGLGNFLICSQTGKALFSIKDIHQMNKVLLKAEENTKEAEKLIKILETYGEKDIFSTWLYMHGFRELGDKLRPIHNKGRRLVTVIRRHLKREISRMDQTPLVIEGVKAFNLNDLLNVLHTIDPAKIQQFSDNDVFSTWLDCKGYPELAEELRPIHGSGAKLAKTLADSVEKWTRIYQQRNQR